MFTFVFDEHGWVWVYLNNDPIKYCQPKEVQPYMLWRYLNTPEIGAN